MTARFNWLANQRGLLPGILRMEEARRPKRSHRGRLLLLGLTLIWGFWLTYRWLLQPAWFSWLPPLGAEMVGLAELSGTLTLIIVWTGLWIRRRKPFRRTPVPVRLDALYQLSPSAFESFVAALFRRKGYQVKMRGGAGDHGVDLEVDNAVGKRAIVQCKRYQNTVGEEVVRDLLGTLIHERAYHAFLVTTADISTAAREWSQGKPMTLIDGSTLEKIVASLDKTTGH